MKKVHLSIICSLFLFGGLLYGEPSRPPQKANSIITLLEVAIKPLETSLLTISPQLTGMSNREKDSLLWNYTSPDSLLQDLIQSSSFIHCMEDSAEASRVRSVLKRVAITLEYVEGEYFTTTSIGSKLALFGDQITTASKEFLKKRAMIDSTQPFADGGFFVPLDTIANWCLFYETFTNKYPYSFFAEKAEEERLSLIQCLVGGGYNAPAFDGLEAYEEYRSFWKVFSNTNRGTKSGSLIGEWYNLFTSEGSKWSDACKRWCTQNSIEMNGVSY